MKGDGQEKLPGSAERVALVHWLAAVPAVKTQTGPSDFVDSAEAAAVDAGVPGHSWGAPEDPMLPATEIDQGENAGIQWFGMRMYNFHGREGTFKTQFTIKAKSR